MTAGVRTAVAALVFTVTGAAIARGQAPSPTPLPAPSPVARPTPLATPTPVAPSPAPAASPVPFGVVPPTVIIPGVPAFPASPVPAASPTPIPPSVTYGAPGPAVRPHQLPPVTPPPAVTPRAGRLTTSPAIPGIDPHLLRIGDRVRAWRTDDAPPVRGLVVAATAAALTVTTRDHAQLVPFEDVVRLEVLRTRKRTRRGALIGAAVGLLAGALVMTDVGGGDLNRLERAGGTLAFGAAGAGAGAYIGARIRTGDWRTVDLPPPPPRVDSP